MQERIQQRMEDYLSGKLEAGADPAFDRLLAESPHDRAVLDSFLEQSLLLRETLKAPADVAPRYGFADRVVARIKAEERERAASFWSIFIEPFTQRLVIASATLLVLLSVGLMSLDDTQEDLLTTTSPSSAVETVDLDEVSPYRGLPASVLVDDHPEVSLQFAEPDPAENQGRVLAALTLLTY